MNKIILSGNLCKDIELKYTNNNKAVMQNTLAVKNDFKNANGEYESQFINLVVWNNNAEYLKKYASKGSKVLVEGKLTNRSYDKTDGTKAYITEVVVEKVELLSSTNKNVAKQETQESDPFKEFGEEIKDEDLPF